MASYSRERARSGTLTGPPPADICNATASRGLVESADFMGYQPVGRPRRGRVVADGNPGSVYAVSHIRNGSTAHWHSRERVSCI